MFPNGTPKQIFQRAVRAYKQHWQTLPTSDYVEPCESKSGWDGSVYKVCSSDGDLLVALTWCKTTFQPWDSHRNQ